MEQINLDQIHKAILQTLEEVKQTDGAYQELVFNDETKILGANSPFDSIGLSAFLTGLEERIEEISGRPCVLDLEAIYEQNGGKTDISVQELTNLISEN